jgi:CCR4-NOT transcription complex subunit 1
MRRRTLRLYPTAQYHPKRLPFNHCSPRPVPHGWGPDSVPEMGPIPPILSDFTAGLKSGDLRVYLDQYLLGRTSSTYLPTLKDRLRASTSDDVSETYDVPFLNALVMYVGVSSVAQAKAKSGSSLFNASDPGVVALRYLAKNLEPEGAPSFTA